MIGDLITVAGERRKVVYEALVTTPGTQEVKGVKDERPVPYVVVGTVPA